MTSDRKHPSAAFWITVALVVVLVGYPVSFGPACWIAERNWTYVPIAICVYGPLVQIAYNGPVWVKGPLRWWASVGTSEGPAEQPFIISILQLGS
jgi:hypothetical protein